MFAEALHPFIILQWDFWGWFSPADSLLRTSRRKHIVAYKCSLVRCEQTVLLQNSWPETQVHRCATKCCQNLLHLQVGFFTIAVHFCWSSLHSNNILYLVIYKFYVFHIQCNRLIIQHLIQQTNNNKQSSLYNIPPTCFGLYMAIFKEDFNKGIHKKQILW
jgi:hypothetical protein